MVAFSVDLNTENASLLFYNHEINFFVKNQVTFVAE